MKTPRNNTVKVDFDKQRRRRQRMHRLRQLGILLLIVLGVFVALYINDLLIREDLPSQLGGLMESVGGSGYPMTLPGGVIRDVGKAGESLVILNDTNLSFYNQNGKLTANVQKMNDRTVMVGEGERVLTYTMGGHEVLINGTSGTIYTREMTDSVLSAAMGKGGDYAVVTTPKQFVAQVDVYDAKNEWRYTRAFPDNVVAQVAISPKGENLAVGHLTTVEGSLETLVVVYSLTADEVKASFSIPDGLLVSLEYLDERTIAVLTDRQYLLFDDKGERFGEYNLPDSLRIRIFESDGTSMLLACENNTTREQDVILLDGSAVAKGRIDSGGRVLDAVVSSQGIYLLTANGVSRYNNSLELQEEYPVQSVQRMEAVGDRIYLLTKTEIEILGAEVPEAESSEEASAEQSSEE